MAIIKTKTETSGVTMGVTFNQGIAEVSDPWLIQRFKEKGYEVDVDAKVEKNNLETENKELKAKIAKLEAELETGNAEPDRVEMKAKLTELGVEFPGNISNEKLKALYDESIKKDGE